MVLEVSAVAIDPFAVSVMRRRFYPTGEAGLYDESGRWNEISPENIPARETAIKAFIVAINPHEVQNLPEGIRAAARWVMWTRAEIQAPDDTQGLLGDEILWADEWQGVLATQPRREGGFTRAVLGPVRERGRSVG
jgi:hypothetical protein